jgi:sporulation protein YlmC with PRC-barrel domain
MATEGINDYSYLEELSESDFEIVDGQPNIQGWDVFDSAGAKIGEVDDLLFNPQSRKVRYIVLDMENNDLDLEDGHVLIPIGVAELHENDDTVLIPEITVAQITSLPLYERGREITAETEAEIRKVFVRPIIGDGNGNVVPGGEFYEHEHFNETKFYGNRRPTAHLDDEFFPPQGDSTEAQKNNRDNIAP